MDEDEFESLPSISEDPEWMGSLNQAGLWPIGEPLPELGDEAPAQSEPEAMAVDEREGERSIRLFGFPSILPTDVRGRIPLGPSPRAAGRIRGKAFFLTYSQSAIPRDVITQWFARQIRMKRVIVGQEHHQDGNLHWHVLIEYEVEKDMRAGTYFNINGEHPNILIWQRTNPTRQSYENWFKFHWDYCKKEDQTPFIVGEEPTSDRKRKRDELFTDAIKIARTASVNHAMKFLEQNAPYDFLTKYDQIGRALVKVRNVSTQLQFPARPLSAFPLAPEIVGDWHCLYINGKTGLGKTQWARALLPEATVVSHRNQLADCDFSKGVIFDDFEVSHWPPTAVIHLLDWDEARGLDVKHGHVVIPAHTKKIFTTNCDFDRWVSKDSTDAQVEACKRRVHVVNIHVRTF